MVEPSTDEVWPDGEAALAAALAPFGWTCTPDFWQRYYSDAWVFNLANAVQKLSERTCPHIVQDTEGTAFCDLAESGINRIGGQLHMAEKDLAALTAERDRLREALAAIAGTIHESVTLHIEAKAIARAALTQEQPPIEEIP